jgi:hypothetical protein
MRVRRILGLALVVIGVVWIAQGLGTLHGSPMTGHGLWTVLGAALGLIGSVLLFGATRARKRIEKADD